jgi:hypothetical protein
MQNSTSDARRELLQVQLPAGLHRALAATAAERFQTKSAFVRELIRREVAANIVERSGISEQYLRGAGITGQAA